jgi:hypothetical protein
MGLLDSNYELYQEWTVIVHHRGYSESGPPAASQFTIARISPTHRLILGLILNLEYMVHAAWHRWPHHILYAS